MSKQLASLEKGSDIKSSSFLAGSSSSCLTTKRVVVDMCSIVLRLESLRAQHGAMSLFRSANRGEKRKTLYQKQTMVKVKMTFEKRSGPGTGATRIVVRDNQDRERIFSPVPLFRDSQILRRQRQDRGDSPSLSQAMLGECCCGPRTAKPVAVDGWVQLDGVESSRVESLRFDPRTGWSVCHLNRRLISIKRVDDAESSISTMGKCRESAKSTRETLRGGERVVLRGGRGE